MARFPFQRQLDTSDCGPTCLAMIAKHHGKPWPKEALGKLAFQSAGGVTLHNLMDAATQIGLIPQALALNYAALLDKKLPALLHWQGNHYVVVYRLTPTRAYIADPKHGKVVLTRDSFLKAWTECPDLEEDPQGVALLLSPGPHFQDLAVPNQYTGFANAWLLLKNHLSQLKPFFLQLLFGLLLGSIFQALFPFFTQALVDFGIQANNLNFIYLILLAQLGLFIGKAATEVFRGWFLLHLGARLNLSILSGFLHKLMRLPMPFFDSKNIGDILQRIEDHGRIENFLSSATLSGLFALSNLAIFSLVLWIYHPLIFVLFLVGSLVYIAWVICFLRRLRDLDYKRFQKLTESQSQLIQMLSGMQEIKLNGCEQQQQWDWERIQVNLFGIQIQRLSAHQWQVHGAQIINELKNILMTFVAATMVVNGEISLGMMLAIVYIIGQLNGPIAELLTYIQSAQFAQISLERLAEVHQRPDEVTPAASEEPLLPAQRTLLFRDVSFQYEGPHSPKALKNLSLEIPEGKVTAIVGSSGSGKTTLLRLILKFFEPTEGSILVGCDDLQTLHSPTWRATCGVVMQEGFIFSKSVAYNISFQDHPDPERLDQALAFANLKTFVTHLPEGLNTKVGPSGQGLSQGQKQRLLIARAVYKNPSILIFDEATNALDAKNENVILRQLQEFFKNRTVVVVAHRLSTVRNADKIVVLEKGELLEEGEHHQLIAKKGAYFHLIRNQLELGG